MNCTTRHLAGITLSIVALFLLSCVPGGSATSPAMVSMATPATAIQPTTAATVESPEPTATVQRATATAPRPTDTAQPTVTLRPSYTPQPSPSPMPTPTSTQTARVVQPITPANASQVVFLDRLGTGALQDMAWLPDGQTVVAVYDSGFSLYGAGSLQERQFIPAYGAKYRLAASPDGRHVAVIAGDGVQLWDLSSGQRVQTLEAPSGGTRLIAFGAGGQALAIAGAEVEEDSSDEIVAVWDISGVLDGSSSGGQLLYRLEGFGAAVSGLAFSPDGGALVTSRQRDWSNPNDTTPLALWDAATGQPLPVAGDLSIAPGGLEHLVFSPDGRLLAGSEGSTLYVWDGATGKLMRTLDNQLFADTVAFSADGRWLAAGSSDNAARVWDVPAGELGMTLSGHTQGVTRVAFDPAPSSGTDTVLLATATARDGIQLWDVERGQRIAARPPVGHTDDVRAVAFSPDGELLATGSTDQTVWFWDADSGQPLRMLDAAGMSTGELCACIWSLAFSPDGKTVATGSTDARVRLWDVESGELLATSVALGDLVLGLAFSPDGQRLAAGDADGLVSIWDMAAPFDSPPLLALASPPTAVSVSFHPSPSSPSAHLLAIGSGSGAIQVWDVDMGILLREMEGSHNAVLAVYGPDGSVLAAGDSGWAAEFPIRLWDPGSGELRQSLQGHRKDIGGLAFTSDGRLLASGDWGGTTRLWDVATGEQLKTLEQGQAIHGVAFRPDGGQLATAGFDGLVWIWGVR